MRARIGVVALLVFVAASAASVSAPAQAADTFVLGSGGASGTVFTVRAYYAGLSIPVPVGVVASTYEAKRARALGAVVSAATVSGLAGVDVPGTSPVTVDSQGQHTLDTAIAAPVAGTVSLEATGVPTARGDVHLADVDVSGAVRIEGGRASSSTRSEGNRRVADAAVTISSVSLGGGLVELRGLRWEASHRSGDTPAPEMSGAFTLGGLTIAGVALPLPAGAAALNDVITLVNGTLAPVGIAVHLPEVQYLPDGSVDIGALRVSYGRGLIGTQVVGPVLTALRPLLLPALEAVVTASPSLGIATLLADLGLGVADGTGGAELLLGGANAFTGSSTFANPLAGGTAPLAAPQVGAPAVAGPSATGGPLSAPVAAVSPTPPEIITSAAGAGSERCALAASPRRHGSCRWSSGGAAAAVGIAAVLLIAGYEIALRRRRIA